MNHVGADAGVPSTRVFRVLGGDARLPAERSSAVRATVFLSR